MECTDQKKLLLMKHKAENFLRLWWQRSSDHVKNYRYTSFGDPYVKKHRSIRMFGTITGLAFSCYLVMIFWAIHLLNVDNRTNSISIRRAPRCELPYWPGYPYVHLNVTSKRRPTAQR